jgi:hypothetical protein
VTLLAFIRIYGCPAATFASPILPAAPGFSFAKETIDAMKRNATIKIITFL